MMKKLLLALVSLSFVFSASADNAPKYSLQSAPAKKNEGGEKCFNESTHIVNLGFGIGRTYHAVYKYAGYKSGSTPAISLSYEQAWPKKLGPGFLGVGAYLGHQYSFSRYDYTRWDNNTGWSTYYSHHKWNYFMLAARAAYHWDVLNSKTLKYTEDLLPDYVFRFTIMQLTILRKKIPTLIMKVLFIPPGRFSPGLAGIL